MFVAARMRSRRIFEVPPPVFHDAIAAVFW